MLRISPGGLVFIFLTIVFTVAGQLLVKRGVLGMGTTPVQLHLLIPFLWRAFTNIYVILGLSSAVVAAGCWTIAVSRSDLSVAYPFMALAIVLVLALSGAVFGEIVPAHRWFGVAIVCLGLVIAALH